jgi:hypothetical protein
MPEYFDQISQKEIDWLKARWAHFTGSQADRLMHTGIRPMTKEELKSRPPGNKNKTLPSLWGKTAITYIEEVATECVSEFNMDGGFENRAMRKGKLNEPISFKELENRLRLRKGILHYHGGDDPQFFEYSSYFGVSPDIRAVTPKGKTSFGAELKNPDTKQHFLYLLHANTGDKLKLYHPEYYGQCQSCCMKFETDHWLFVSFNEHMKNYADRMLIVEVKADKQYITNLDLRLKMANKEKEKMIQLLETRRGEI